MGLFIRFLAITALVSSTVVGQSAGPSPTASVGCEPHGDHWHCDGPASTVDSSMVTTTSETSTLTETLTTSGTVITTSTSAASIMASPTESTGCEPHGDHWHCDGPAETSSAASASPSAGSEGEDNGVGSRRVEILLLAGLAVVAAGFNA